MSRAGMRTRNYRRFAKVVFLALSGSDIHDRYRPVNYLENPLIINVTARNTIAICIPSGGYSS